MSFEIAGIMPGTVTLCKRKENLVLAYSTCLFAFVLESCCVDGNRFDDLTKRLAADASRRSVLKRTAAAAAALTGLGQISTSEAARRPTPTPKPVTCPGRQVWNGSACACPSGTSNCGPDCCPPEAPCCDGACCYGACYAEELCCPYGQIVCDGVCLAPGQCCADADCGPGLGCSGNVCVCLPSSTCATAGLNCGTFTDECGGIHDCGVCAEPQTCGGGGTPGVCGCTSQMTCEGKCGAYMDECGSEVNCGETCGACQICGDNNTCSATSDGESCAAPDLCQVGTCSNGTCVATPKTCPECQICRNGECVADDSCVTCPDGLDYYHGNCCNMPKISGVIPDDITLMGCGETDSICCDADEGPCCPGTGQCCEICVTYVENGVSKNKCCEPENICGENCCWFTHMCVEGSCVERNRVCAENVICDDVCCGAGGSGAGTCCGPNAYCVNGGCQPVSTDECTSHDECESLYGSGAVCAGLDFIPGPEPMQVRTPGVCCPDAFSFMARFGGTGPIYACCRANERPMSQGGCCSYPWHACDSTGTCTCSRASIRRWGG